MTNCEQCNALYDEQNINVPTPLPDGMCAVCGTQLTQEQIKELIAKAKPTN